MKIKSLNIQNIGGIEAIDLEFSPNINIICGPNGIGKTTILDVVSHSLCPKLESSNILKRKANSSNGFFEVSICDDDGKSLVLKQKVLEFLPNESVYLTSQADDEMVKKIIVLKTNRYFDYQKLDSIPSDVVPSVFRVAEENRKGINYSAAKGWFVNRYLYSARKGVLSYEQEENFKLAEASFALLDENFKFYKVEPSSNDILVNTPTGIIYYEYLSAGFKSLFCIIVGVIKEIEFRFKEVAAENFDGIIVIDEIELHFHPEWQEKILKVLKEVFPRVQFIVSTHSPHIIQTAEASEVIALEKDENFVIKRKQLMDLKYGFKGWTIEEILKDVMGMESLRTRFFEETLSLFSRAIVKEDLERAQEIFKTIDEMLHPNNELRTLFEFQISQLKYHG